jgi:hypothetical protein
VENETQRTRLRDAVRNIKGVTDVSDVGLQMIGPPFCDVLDLLEPLQQQTAAQAPGFAVRLINKDVRGRPIYVQSEHLIIEVTTPAKFESFVYVDYYTTDGQVQHLFPNPQEVWNLFKPQSVHTLGRPDHSGLTWKPLPPFGRELITVIATKKPLIFTPKAPRYEPEPATLYLNQLRQALPRELSPAEIAVAFYVIETRERL